MTGTLGGCAELALSQDPAAALAQAEAQVAAHGPDAESVALLAFTQVLNCQFDAAVAALPMTADPLGRATAAFVSAVCLAQMPDATTEQSAPGLLGLHAFLTAEAAMSAGQVVRAEQHTRSVAPALRDLADGTFWAWNQIILTRALAFQGRIPDALVEIDRVLSDVRADRWPGVDRIARGVHAFVAAHGGDHEPSSRFAAGLDDEVPEPRTYLEAAAFVLAAFAEQASGRLVGLDRLLLQGGGGPFLPRFQVVDRCYAYEILVEVALERGDLRQALDWFDLAEVLPVDDHDLASAAIGRSRARIALAQGDPAASAQESARSSERAASVGGGLEVRRGQLLRAWAVRELSQRGRRLRNVPGVGWEALTDRQRLVALHAARGLRNREIAEQLHLSERTVEGHVAAVLGALGAPSRVRIGQHVPASAAAPTPCGASLTPRQRTVADLVAAGCSNAAIAAALRISEKTVEKHVADLFARLGVQSRTAVAAAVRG